MKILISTSSHYLGSCVDSFDADGDAEAYLPYSNTSDFANAEENYLELSRSEFAKSITLPAWLNRKKLKYYVDPEHKYLYIAYDVAADVHYFFTVK